MVHMKRRLVLGGLLALVVGLLTAWPAFAAFEYDEGDATSYSCTAAYPVEGSGTAIYGRGCFSTASSNFYLEDLSSDGRRVGIQWHNESGSRTGLCVWAGGRFTKGVCNKSFANPDGIFWRVGRCDGSVGPGYCKSPANWTNWSIWAPYTPRSRSTATMVG